MNNLNQKSMLARLLSKENIEVRQGNYPTAWFDVENRVLGLPYFKDEVSKDEVDLFVGHEVGHALYTPSEGWHDSATEIPNVPRSVINIVEDIRIEKKVLREYPGLVAAFKRGYKSLLNRDFFGIKDVDVNTLNFLDRLNLHSKARGAVPVDFFEDEIPYLEEAMRVESWEDVVTVCTKIADWMGLNNEQEEQENQESQTEYTSGQDDDNPGDQTSDELPQIQDSEESDEENEGASAEQTADQGDADESDAQGVGSEEDAQSDDDSEQQVEQGQKSDSDDKSKNWTAPKQVSVTDDAFRRNEKNLTDNVAAGGLDVYVKGMPRPVFEEVKISFEQQQIERVKRHANEIHFPQTRYDRWLKEATAQVNLLVKEFEMRKAAYRTKRARTSTKGSLDVTKLHAYKYDDNLFKQVTHLADAKSHGMLMLVDFSGSMFSTIESVLRQTLIMVEFCKRVNIPFEVYGFTDASGEQYFQTLDFERDLFNDDTNIETGGLQLTELVTSRMDKATYEKATKIMWNIQRQFAWGGGYDAMRSTPLYPALMAMHYVAEDFQKRYAVQKLNLTVLTDGWGDSLEIRYGGALDINNMDEDDYANWRRNWNDVKHYLDFRGRTMQAVLSPRRWYHRGTNDPENSIQKVLLNNFKEEFGASICHYSVVDNAREFKHEVYRALGSWDNVTTEMRNARKKGAFVTDNIDGYDRRFILEANSDVLQGSRNAGESYDISDTMTPAQVASAFKKHANGKKKQRFFSQKFADMVA
jgi:cobalamin biosynthesis protein CobT